MSLSLSPPESYQALSRQSFIKASPTGYMCIYIPISIYEGQTGRKRWRQRKM